jgi:hypothetical protein
MLITHIIINSYDKRDEIKRELPNSSSLNKVEEGLLYKDHFLC